MQTFESGGAIRVRPMARLQLAMTMLGIATAAVALPPLLGIYVLLVA